MLKLTLIAAVFMGSQVFAKPPVIAATCSLDQAASAALVAKALERHPEKKNNDGDSDAITVTHLKSFSATIRANVVLAGAFDGEGSNPKDFEVKFTRDSTSVDDTVVVKIDADGWDHYNYRVSINTVTGQATVRENFDFDCGGDGSMGLGLMTCAVSVAE